MSRTFFIFTKIVKCKLTAAVQGNLPPPWSALSILTLTILVEMDLNIHDNDQSKKISNKRGNKYKKCQVRSLRLILMNIYTITTV